MHWNYLRNVCLDQQQFLLHLYQAVQSDVDMSNLSSYISILPTLQVEDVVSTSSHSVWILYASHQLDEFFQQLSLLHSVAIHPDQFPPVGPFTFYEL